MEIRPASPADADRIHEVSRAACVAAYEEPLEDQTLVETVDDPARVPRIRDRLADVVEDDRVTYLVAERERIVGFAQMLRGGRTPEHVGERAAYLRSLYVHPDHWGEGIGSELLAAACARQPGATRRIVVSVLAANDHGRSFYEARGFERVDTGRFETRGVGYETAIYARTFEGGRSAGE